MPSEPKPPATDARATDQFDTPPPPKVSVLILCRNQAGPLRKTLASLERSEHRQAIEVVVVDSGSSDGSEAMDGEFPGINMLRLPKNFGATKAKNIGTRTATGEFLLFLDPGYEVSPDTVHALAASLESQTGANAVCPLVTGPNGPPPVYALPDAAWFSQPRTTAVTFAGPSAVEFPAGWPMMVRRQLIAGSNYFDERYGHHWTDADLAIRIHKAGRRILVLPDIAVAAPEGGVAPVGLQGSTAERSDYLLGAAHYLGKHRGAVAGLLFQAKSILLALLTLRLPLFFALLSGRKIDRTQPE
ncbi:MAG: glycosyltransferase [Acidobacteria bacterium]|nr:glycosyltransferase [Acidobacteriota bacterium]